MIYFNGPISRLQISQATGLSPATVTNVVAELLAEGAVLEAGTTESEGGRPSTILAINPDYGYLVGIDVGETMIQVELFDVSMKRLAQIIRPLDQNEIQPEQVINNIVEGVEALLAGIGERRNSILGVGIGFPGLVNPASGVSVFAPNWGWHNVPVGEMLEERLQLPLLLDNGAKTMALAESMFGAGKHAESIAVLLIGTGVGAGIVNHGELFRGISNSAGEWGHTTLELDGRLCRCGNHGCLEAYAGAPNIISRYLESAPESHLPSGSDQLEKLTVILNRARAGEPAAVKVMDETARYIGVGVANLINLVNPGLVVLGGWVGLLLGDLLLPKVQEVVQKTALVQALQNSKIGLCELGYQAVAMGAATLVLDHFLETAGEPEKAKPAAHNGESRQHPLYSFFS
ncbi:MAG: ROK family protein [Chloroflexi bacterium]|nr:ROK family protein [Anaerolineaceae bacterium]NMB90063.1 ROK family protein [Chloroflexota bacterium]